MKPNNKINYDIQYNKFKTSPVINDSEIPPFEEVVRAHKIWIKKTRLQMILRYSLSCLAAAVIAFVGFNFIKKNPELTSLPIVESKYIAKDTSVVRAPVKAWDIPYQTYKINADSLSVIKMPSGTTITIAPNTLVDSNGIIITGEANIECREFFDPIDIVVAGIPMEYDSAGIKYTLETAGMIEINGSQNNQPLKIGNGKSIAIAQMSFGGNDYNTYSLDTKSGQWTYEGKPEIKKIISEVVEKKVIESVNIPIHSSKNNLEYDKDNHSSVINAPKLQNESNPSFRLEVDKNVFPELAVYNNVLFEIKPGQGFNSTNEEWDWIELKQGSRPNEYKVFLHDGGKTISALVSPVFKEGEDYNQALKTFKKYEKTELDKIESNKKIEAENWRKLERQAELAAKAEMEKWKNRIDENSIVREFTIGSFGYWNSDRPFPNSSPRTMTVKVELSEKNIQLITLFHIENGTNTIFTHHHSEPNTFNIQYDAMKENTWFVIIPNTQKIAVVFPSDFTKQLSSHIGILNMEIGSLEFKNPKDLKKYLLKRE